MSKNQSDTEAIAQIPAAIIRRPGEGEHFQRSNRTVTIKAELPQLSIHEIEFDTTFEVTPHTHDHVDAMLVLDGEVELLAGTQAERVGPGTVVAVPPGTPHGFRNPGLRRARLAIRRNRRQPCQTAHSCFHPATSISTATALALVCAASRTGGLPGR